MKTEIKTPFLFVNPKSYIYGDQVFAFAKACDAIAGKYGFQIFFTCPYTDIRQVAEQTENLIVTAQNMDSLNPGRGMGAVLPESLAAAGARCVVLNHAENQKKLSELYACINRAKELGMFTVVCADSADESAAVAKLGVDVILAEPTELIGTGKTADSNYIENCVNAIKAVDPEVKVIIGSGITYAEDCYKAIRYGADGAGSTSGILKAEDPVKRVEEMVLAEMEAMKER